MAESVIVPGRGAEVGVDGLELVPPLVAGIITEVARGVKNVAKLPPLEGVCNSVASPAGLAFNLLINIDAVNEGPSV